MQLTHQARLEQDRVSVLHRVAESRRAHAVACTATDGSKVLTVCDAAGRLACVRLTQDAADRLILDLLPRRADS